MKHKKIELDVDFIGGQNDTLTKEEEQALHAYFEKRKLTLQKQHSNTKSKSAKHTTTTT
ncbi:MAG: hypothetical protein ACERKD_02840 [Prolixibacteraceae bacterium]